ncbi:hypothetical protein ONS95_010548 [Cadophora gregata]|uniref:uncharacterized protein n=1 Tax=Cadophora gregata TaxID=51156 RepID=UPI0026DAF111|nr:uncharacterized protein ONS95_010548 [Cadophora gregata]KAK0122303.1 hypothetical protein ONS95_010548 [Cadophora gregata]
MQADFHADFQRPGKKLSPKHGILSQRCERMQPRVAFSKLFCPSLGIPIRAASGVACATCFSPGNFDFIKEADGSDDGPALAGTERHQKRRSDSRVRNAATGAEPGGENMRSISWYDRTTLHIQLRGLPGSSSPES